MAASATSNLLVSITANGAGQVSSGGAGSATVQMISGTGTAPVTFSQAGDNNYNPAATVVTENVTAQKANQTVTVTQAAPASAVYGTSFVVAASATSNLPVSITASSAGQVSSGGAGSATVQMISGTGTAPVTFSQAGDNNYNPAAVVIENVSAQKANQTVTLTQAPPANAVYGSSFVVAATATSGLPVSIAASGAALRQRHQHQPPLPSTAPPAPAPSLSARPATIITPAPSRRPPYRSSARASPSSAPEFLWYVSTVAKSKNLVQINPAGTGIMVNGAVYSQSFSAIRIFGYNGNDTIQLNSLTISTPS